LNDRINSYQEAETLGLADYSAVLTATEVADHMHSEVWHLQDTLSLDFPEKDDGIVARVTGLVEEVGKDPNVQVVFLFTPMSVLHIVKDAFNAPLEGADFNYVRLISLVISTTTPHRELQGSAPQAVKTRVRLVPCSGEIVSISKRMLARTAVEMMASHDQQYAAILESYQQQVKAKQDQLRRKDAAIFDCVRSTQQLYRTMEKALKLLKPSLPHNPEASESSCNSQAVVPEEVSQALEILEAPYSEPGASQGVLQVSQEDLRIDLVKTGERQYTYTFTSLASVPLQAKIWCCELDEYVGLETTYYPNQPSSGTFTGEVQGTVTLKVLDVNSTAELPTLQFILA
jgi:hypothetical protein